MSKRRKSKAEEEKSEIGSTDEELTAEVKEKIFTASPIVADKPTETVKVKVLIGTLKWEAGTFEKGEVFKCSRERALSFGDSIKILE